MTKLKLASQFIYKDLWHYFLVTAVLLCVILLCLALSVAFINSDQYLSLSKDLKGRDYYYFSSISSGNEASQALADMDGKVKVYGVNRYGVHSSSGLVDAMALSTRLFEEFYFQTQSGLKKFSAADGALATKDSGLKVGDIINLQMPEGNIDVKISGLLADSSPFPSFSTSGNDMTVDYLYKTRKAGDAPVIILPAEKYNIRIRLSTGALLDFSGCGTADLDNCLTVLSGFGTIESIDVLYEKSTARRNGFLQIALPVIILGVIFIVLLLTVVLGYGFKKYRRELAVMKTVGWKNSDIISVYMYMSAIMTVFLLFLAVPLTIGVAFLLSANGIMYKISTFVLIWAVAAAFINICAFAISSIGIKHIDYDVERCL